jgi:hypothetical protein
MSIAQLEAILAGRKTELNQKRKEHSKLLSRLQELDAEIRHLGGAPGRGRGRGTGGGGARNEKSLVETLEEVLKAGKPMSVGDITNAAEESGYRSNSKSFRGIVNQTLIKEKRFIATERGVYQLDKAP